MKTSRKALSRSGRVAALLTLIAVVAACGSDNPSDTAATSGPSTGSAASASTPPFIGPTAGRQNVKLLPVEARQDDAFESFADENAVVVSVACTQGHVPLPLAINGSTHVSSQANVVTTVTSSDATIEPTGEIPAVRALIVNGVHATHISDAVAEDSNTSLRLAASDWRVPTITSLTFCLKVPSFNVPVPTR